MEIIIGILEVIGGAETIKDIGASLILLITLLVVLVLIIKPALGQIGQMKIKLQRQSDLLEQAISSLKEVKWLVHHNRQDTELLRRAIRVAFAGRSNGHTWEEAKVHYRVASELLADDEADRILREVEEGGKK